MRMFLEHNKNRIEQKYDRLCREFPDFFGPVNEKLKDCREPVALAMKWMYGVMPWSDRGNYPFETFLDFAEHGVWLYETKESVRRLPEEIFLNYVLYHRVNEEEIRPCRRLFYDSMKEQIGGREGSDAAIEVHYWCAAEATYQSTDDRTLSALAVWQRGSGRCGEESTFTVNAMRSAGIPARQVYAPKWSHCDDNHAWVEVWTDGKWQFTGACEPLPILNKGWFTNASSRAMMVHARWFDDCLPEDEERIGKEGMVTMLNELSRYAAVKPVEVIVRMEDGSPAEGAVVQFEVMNYAEYAPIAETETDESGRTMLTTGLGTLHLWARKDGQTGEALLDVRESGRCEILLCSREQEYGWKDCDMIAPVDTPVNTDQPTPEQAAEGSRRLREAEQRRREKTGGWENPELQAFHSYLDTLGEKESALGRELLETLTEKDRTDCRCEVLKSHLEETLSLTGADVPEPHSEERSLFVAYVLNPRVEYEVLTPYRRALLEWLSETERIRFREDPKLLWEKICGQIQERPQEERSSLVTSPAACVKTGVGSRRSKEILFVAAARSLGIPARLNPDDGAMEFRKDGAFVPVLAEREKNCSLKLQSGKGTVWKYFQNWSIARRTEQGWHSLQLGGKTWTEDGCLELRLEAGLYRLITSNRLPNGNQFARQCQILLKPGCAWKLTMELRDADLSDMLESINLPEFQVQDRTGTAVSASELTDGACRVMLWLEESKEPTEHILNEMMEQAEAFRTWMSRIVFVVRSEEALQDPTVQKALREFPEIPVYYDDFEENVYVLGRRMYVDHEKLPMILVTDGCRNGIYAASGYNVGTGDMLLRILESREK